jgi:AraC family transcriptional regulator
MTRRVSIVLAYKKNFPKLIDSTKLYRYSPGRLESSSEKLGWKNILLTRFVYDSHYMFPSPRPATPDHAIILLDSGHFKGQISYNHGHYRPCMLHQGECVLGQAFENHFDGFGKLIHNEEQAFATLVIHIPPKLLTQVAGDMSGIDADKIELTHRINIQDPLMTQMANALKRQLQLGNNQGKIYAESSAYLLAAHLIQNYSVNNTRFPVVKGRPGNRIRKVLEYIYHNMHTEISIENLSTLTHMSPYYFIKWFKNQLGETPYQYIVRRRMEKAQYLLKNTDKSVIEIALEIGYCYACNFSNAFKQYTGITPNSYRKSCK